MKGMNKTTGKWLEGVDHIRQSIKDIIQTDIGARVLRREYGSNLSRLVDSPTNEETRMALTSSVVTAIDLWEPRVKIKNVQISIDPTTKKIGILLNAVLVETGKTIVIDGIEI